MHSFRKQKKAYDIMLKLALRSIPIHMIIDLAPFDTGSTTRAGPEPRGGQTARYAPPAQPGHAGEDELGIGPHDEDSDPLPDVNRGYAPDPGRGLRPRIHHETNEVLKALLIMMSPKAPVTKGFTRPNLVLREATAASPTSSCAGVRFPHLRSVALAEGPP